MQIYLEDLEILQKIVEKKIRIDDVSNETKKRLIVMCKQRLSNIQKRIEEKNEEIIKLEQLIRKK